MRGSESGGRLSSSKKSMPLVSSESTAVPPQSSYTKLVYEEDGVDVPWHRGMPMFA
jgi:hypothetical protein